MCGHLLWDRHEVGTADTAQGSTDTGPALQPSGERRAQGNYDDDTGVWWPGHGVWREAEAQSLVRALTSSTGLSQSQCISGPQLLICEMGMITVRPSHCHCEDHTMSPCLAALSHPC